MKNQTKAVIASIAVIALALTAVSGITYSWFSDTEKADITVSTAVVNYAASFNIKKDSTNSMGLTDNNDNSFTVSNLKANQSATIECSMTNHSTIATKYKVVVTPTLEDDHTITVYDLSNVLIKVGDESTSLIENGSVKDVIVKGWTDAPAPNDPSVGNVIQSIEIEISTPTTYGGDPEDPGKITYTEGGQTKEWNAQTVRSGLTLEFKVIAVQGDYPTTP